MSNSRVLDSYFKELAFSLNEIIDLLQNATYIENENNDRASLADELEKWQHELEKVASIIREVSFVEEIGFSNVKIISDKEVVFFENEEHLGEIDELIKCIIKLIEQLDDYVAVLNEYDFREHSPELELLAKKLKYVLGEANLKELKGVIDTLESYLSMYEHLYPVNTGSGFHYKKGSLLEIINTAKAIMEEVDNYNSLLEQEIPLINYTKAMKNANGQKVNVVQKYHLKDLTIMQNEILSNPQTKEDVEKYLIIAENLYYVGKLKIINESILNKYDEILYPILSDIKQVGNSVEKLGDYLVSLVQAYEISKKIINSSSKLTVSEIKVLSQKLNKWDLPPIFND